MYSMYSISSGKELGTALRDMSASFELPRESLANASPGWYRCRTTLTPSSFSWALRLPPPRRQFLNPRRSQSMYAVIRHQKLTNYQRKLPFSLKLQRSWEIDLQARDE